MTASQHPGTLMVAQSEIPGWPPLPLPCPRGSSVGCLPGGVGTYLAVAVAVAETNDSQMFGRLGRFGFLSCLSVTGSVHLRRPKPTPDVCVHTNSIVHAVINHEHARACHCQELRNSGQV
jgi:hypothetical protein